MPQMGFEPTISAGGRPQPLTARPVGPAALLILVALTGGQMAGLKQVRVFYYGLQKGVVY